MFCDSAESHYWCIGDDDQNPKMGFHSIYLIGRFKAKNGGFLVNGEVSFVAVCGALEVTGIILYVPEEFENDNGAVSSDLNKETMDVNGIQVLRSQVRNLYERWKLFQSFNLKS